MKTMLESFFDELEDGVELKEKANSIYDELVAFLAAEIGDNDQARYLADRLYNTFRIEGFQ